MHEKLVYYLLLMNMHTPSFVVIFGPTAVGKTEVALHLAQRYNGAIINADIGQMYTPLNIGTAKPAWQTSTIPHYLFDHLQEPRDYSVQEFRTTVLQLVMECWQQRKLPIIVGGSTLYISSLYFPPLHYTCTSIPVINNNSWHTLSILDPERAVHIHPHDTYRIERALAIWQATGKKPSKLVPVFDPLGDSLILFLNRPRCELYERINQRVIAMLETGWIDEVKALDTTWLSFLERKKLIGYPEIIAFLQGAQTLSTYTDLIIKIQQRTRHYAKRQITFWRMLQKKLQPYATSFPPLCI